MRVGRGRKGRKKKEEEGILKEGRKKNNGRKWK
jgi:hypothetical protein